MLLRRPRLAIGQTDLIFPEIVDQTKPSVTLHKNGRYLLIKANDVMAADALRELQLRMPVLDMRKSKFYSADFDQEFEVEDYSKVELWKHLEGDITRHPFVRLLATYGVEVGTSPSLKGYLVKEHRRQLLENTPLPAPQIVLEHALFDRCSVGLSLLCLKDYYDPAYEAPVFVAGNRYMVVGTGGDGIDKVSISMAALKHDATVSSESGQFDWSPVHPAMEEYFDDSDNVQFGADVQELYPGRIKEMEAKLKKLSFMATTEQGKPPLFKHVAKDAVIEALYRGIVNGKLMRMGKSSESITVCELWGSKRIAIVGTRNVRLAFRREFARLGMADQAIMVNRLADLEKPGKYYMFTFEWLRNMHDPTDGQRAEHTNWLRPAERKTMRKVEYQKKPDAMIVFQFHNCPHCDHALVRRRTVKSGSKVYFQGWTRYGGYLCRNPKCEWTTDNRAYVPKTGKGKKLVAKKAGAAWATEDQSLVKHTGGYLDIGLALHSHCSGEQVKGRMCLECKQTDGSWIPPRYKRVKDLFSAVIGDEIHNAKQSDTRTLNARAMFSFRAKRRMGMSGTLISNGTMDAYWPMHWVFSGPCKRFPYFQNEGRGEFENRFVDHVYLEKGTGDVDPETGQEIVKTIRRQTPFLKNPPDFWRFTSDKIVRRTYDDPLYVESLVEAGMVKPQVKIFTVSPQMVPAQAKLMLDALKDFKEQYQQMVENAEKQHKEVSSALVITKMSALRCIATAPQRLNQRFQAKVYDGPDGGGKMWHIVNLVEDKVKQGGKVLILSDFIEMTRAVHERLSHLNPVRLISGWSDEKRDEAVSRFHDDPECRVFIAGTRAVRESIDLSCADTTICCDLLWSPAFQTQAWSRMMAATTRQRVCEVYLMLSKNTLDEHIYDVFYAKMMGATQALDRKVLERRAQQLDIKLFAERVLEEEMAIELQMREFDNEVFEPEGEMMLLEDRSA